MQKDRDRMLTTCLSEDRMRFFLQDSSTWCDGEPEISEIFSKVKHENPVLARHEAEL
jgi:hypothetical protein